jgi:hypothetical protein
LFESKNYFLQFYYFILKAFFFCFWNLKLSWR